MRIECRWQQQSGSVDEKLWYLFECATDAMPEENIWLIIDGGGARDDAVKRIMQKCKDQKKKNIRVITSMGEARKAIKQLVENDKP